MQHVARKFFSVVCLGLAFVCTGVYAADTAKQPAGTVNITETQFALIVGGSRGSGTLMYQGNTYPFKISGMSVGANIGISKVSLAGEVYDMTDLSKFSGTFTKLESSITLGGGVGGTILKNQNGVIMRLTSTSEGVQLNLSSSGVTVKLEQ